MQALCDSIREYGVLSPLLARSTEEGYELVSGHRRKAAAMRLGLDKLPVLVREMTDDEAVILMVDSNIQRENLLPSEKAFAFSQTLNVVFKDARFNGWCVGEIFAVSSNLIPNARRDNFEKNSEYFLLLEQISKIAVGIVKEIRSVSVKRNASLSNALNKANHAIESASGAISDGCTQTKKSEIRQLLVNAKDMFSDISSTNDIEEHCVEIAFDELDMLIGQVAGATSFKSLNVLQTLSTVEKKILEKVFISIDEFVPTQANEIIEHILLGFYNK